MRARWAVAGAALLVLAGSTGSLAGWRAHGQVDPAAVRSGTLDLTLDGGLAGPGGTHAMTTLALPRMVPGESVARTLTVANAGSVGLGYTATGSASGSLATGLRYSVTTGSAANSGTEAGGNRSGTCSGTVLFGPAALGTSPVPVIPARRALGVGASQPLCLRVELAPTASPTLQAGTATASFAFTAVQQGAP
jgi:hypothetical protein